MSRGPTGAIDWNCIAMLTRASKMSARANQRLPSMCRAMSVRRGYSGPARLKSRLAGPLFEPPRQPTAAPVQGTESQVSVQYQDQELRQECWTHDPGRGANQPGSTYRP